MRDLAESTGISESYLSQVLNGTRRNVSDNYKDRIASALGVSLSGLYMGVAPSAVEEAYYMRASRPEREELKRTIDILLSWAGLQGVQSAFHNACGLLDDRDAAAVNRFTGNVLRSLASDAQLAKPLRPLSAEQVRLLSYCWICGPDAREEWVRDVCGLHEQAFRQGMNDLSDAGYVSLLEEDGITRVRLAQSAPSYPLSSMFTQKGLVAVNLALSSAMKAFSEEGLEFEARLGDVLARAGQYSEAGAHMRKAAEMLEAKDQWYAAAESWQRAAVIASAAGDMEVRVQYLCEAAKCIARSGDLELADLIGKRALAMVEDEDGRLLSSWSGSVAISMGNAFQCLDLDRASNWYKQGLTCTGHKSFQYGSLLVNITSTQLQMKMTNGANESLSDLREWISEQADLAWKDYFRAKYNLLRGLWCHQQQDWVGAKEAFQDVVSQRKEPENEDVAVAWHGLGLLAYYEDNCRESREFLSQAQHVFRRFGLERQMEALYVDTAKVAVREGNYEEAEQLLSRTECSPNERPWILLLRACIEKGRGNVAKAISRAREAIDAFNARGFPNEAACAALWLSELLKQAGDMSGTRFYENWAFSIYDRQGWDVRQLRQQRTLLDPEPLAPVIVFSPK